MLLFLVFLLGSGYIAFISKDLWRFELLLSFLFCGTLLFLLRVRWKSVRSRPRRLFWGFLSLTLVLFLPLFTVHGYWGAPRILPLLLFLLGFVMGPEIPTLWLQRIGLAGLFYTILVPLTFIMSEYTRPAIGQLLDTDRNNLFLNGLDNQNIHAFLVFLLIPFKWTLVCSLRSHKLRAALFLTIVILDFGAFFWLRSGAGAILIALSYGLLFFYHLRWTALPALGVVATLLLLSDLLLFEAFTNATSLQYRMDFLMTAWDLITDYPLGMGPGTQHTIYFSGPFQKVTSQFDYYDSFQLCAAGFFHCHTHLHNAFAGLTLEFGVVFMTLMLAGLVIVKSLLKDYLFFLIALSWLLIDDFSHFPAQMILFGFWAARKDAFWLRLNPFQTYTSNHNANRSS
ncbi:MAG: hypothetical protein CMN76_11765 [Spirochaetaceae bacterium]|nr:hypothetical protein [Spirochaetaceae bacterium]